MGTRQLLPLLALAASAPALASNQTINAVVRLHERVSMESLATSVLDPASPRFGHYYTPDEIRELAGPSEQDYRTAVAALRQKGLTVTAESPTHLWISVQGDSKTFERALGVQVQDLGDGLRKSVRVLRAPRGLPMVATVTGLDNSRKAQPRHTILSTDVRAGGPGGIKQSVIKSAYGLDPIYKAGWSGKDQHIAIATYMGFKIEDVKKFYSLSHLDPTPSVDQVIYNGTPDFDENSSIETALDAEFSGMIAPGSSVHVFASAENSDAGEQQMFTAILDDNRSKVVNYSWGSCEKGLEQSHADEMGKIFARAVAQGVNIMVASGDTGSDGCRDGSKVADWPAAHPDVVAVGGTTFGQNGGHLAEKGWDGSGGGISALFDLPQWQSGLSSPYVKRSYPDVAFNADPATGQAVWTTYNGKTGWLTIGGTSMAAPQWSGYLALVGEARAAKKKDVLGFLNPIVYGLSADERAKMFNDVSSGNNGAYDAATGWDAVTGWGSMQGDSLLDRLVTN